MASSSKKSPVEGKTKARAPARRKATSGDDASASSTQVDGLAPDRTPADVPILYADMLQDVIYGVHTSKLVFSLENGRGKPRPVAVVVLPTAALVFASKSVSDVMSDPGMLSETQARFDGVIDLMRSLKSR